MKNKTNQILSIIFLGILSACGDSESEYLKLCKFAIKETLRSPSTLQVIEVEDYTNSDDPALFIDYDAANAFGTLVRGKARCKYIKENSEIELSSFATGNGEVSDTKLLIINYEWQSKQR